MAVAAKKPLIAEVKKLIAECDGNVGKMIDLAGRWLAWSGKMQAKRKRVMADMKKKPAQAKKLSDAFMKGFWPDYILFQSEDATRRQKLATSAKKVEAFLSKNKKQLNPKAQAPLTKATADLKYSLGQMKNWLKRKRP